MELESIAPSPRCSARATDSVVELVALAQAAALSACGRQPPHLPVLVNWSGDPLGVRVSPDSFMEWINEDNLEEFVRRIFTNPVGIQDPQGPQWRPARSSATDCRLRANLSWLTPWCTGLP